MDKNLENKIEEIVLKIMSNDNYTIVNNGFGIQRHPNWLVGKLWRVNDPNTVRVGNCFLKGRLLSGDLFLCTRHSGDCFQDYIYIEEITNAFIPYPQFCIGSYGIGDSTEVEISHGTFLKLKNGEVSYKERNDN